MTGESRIPRSINPQPESATVSDAQQPDKTTLRRLLRAQRRTIDAATRKQWDARIAENLMAWCKAHQIAELGVYWPLPGEPDLHQAYAQLAKAGVRLALPVVMARDAALEFAEWQPGEPMVEDAMGIAVPAVRRMVARPGALLVPCLGFNAQRYRLGYGGGFYDRTLAALPRPATAGVAYSCQTVAFEADAHDIALDCILTEAARP